MTYLGYNTCSIHIWTTVCVCMYIQYCKWTYIVFELNRVIGKDVAKDFKQQWQEVAPRIVARAWEEVENSYLQTLLEEHSDDLADGKQI